MKKTIILLTMLLIPTIVSAQCSTEETVALKDGINLISVDFVQETIEVEIKESDIQIWDENSVLTGMVEELEILKVNILNLTEDYYIVITNTSTGEEKIVNYSDTNAGSYNYTVENNTNVNQYTYKIFSSGNTGCPDEEVGVKYLTVPKQNVYHYYTVCENYPEEDICQKYVTFDDLDEETFFEKINALEEEKEDTSKEDDKATENSFLNFLNEYKVILIIVGGVLLVGTVITVLVVRNKRRQL